MKEYIVCADAESPIFAPNANKHEFINWAHTAWANVESEKKGRLSQNKEKPEVKKRQNHEEKTRTDILHKMSVNILKKKDAVTKLTEKFFSLHFFNM